MIGAVNYAGIARAARTEILFELARTRGRSTSEPMNTNAFLGKGAVVETRPEACYVGVCLDVRHGARVEGLAVDDKIAGSRGDDGLVDTTCRRRGGCSRR